MLKKNKIERVQVRTDSFTKDLVEEFNDNNSFDLTDSAIYKKYFLKMLFIDDPDAFKKAYTKVLEEYSNDYTKKIDEIRTFLKITEIMDAYMPGINRFETVDGQTLTLEELLEHGFKIESGNIVLSETHNSSEIAEKREALELEATLIQNQAAEYTAQIMKQVEPQLGEVFVRAKNSGNNKYHKLHCGVLISNRTKEIIDFDVFIGRENIPADLVPCTLCNK